MSPASRMGAESDCAARSRGPVRLGAAGVETGQDEARADASPERSRSSHFIERRRRSTAAMSRRSRQSSTASMSRPRFSGLSVGA